MLALHSRSTRAVTLLSAIVAVGCLDLTPAVGTRPLSDEERYGPPDGEAFVSASAVDGGAKEVGSTAVNDTAGGIRFKDAIRPLIVRASNDPTLRGCYPCHDSKAPKHIGVDLGGLDLTTLGKLREGGGTSGVNIVVAGYPALSALTQKLRGTYPYGTRMPKSGPAFWGDREIALVEQWIAEGARGDDDE